MKMSISQTQLNNAGHGRRVFDDIFLFLLAMCPILQHYKGLISNPAMELSVVVMIYAMMKLWAKQKIRVRAIWPLMLYGLYASVAHGFNFTYFLREFLQLVVFLAVINGCIDVKRLMKICTRIALVAAVLLILQYVCYYVMGFHLQLVATSALLESSEQWVALAQTGTISVHGRRMSMYRPSAFFLEPSHLAIFAIPVLVTLMLNKDVTKEQVGQAALISVGVMLSTSGIGIVAVVLLWVLYSIFYLNNRRQDKDFRLRDLLKPNSFLFVMLLIIAFVVLYASVGIFRQSINRIFIESSSGQTAFGGRTDAGLQFLSTLSGKSLLFGNSGEATVTDSNLTGFFLTLFFHGVIGTVLFYLFFVRSMFKVKHEALWMCWMFIGLSFFTAHTYGAYYKMFYTFIVLSAYSNPAMHAVPKQKRKKRRLYSGKV